MGTIGKIREQRKLLFTVVLIALLLFIVPYDSIMSMFNGGAGQQEAIGMFKGEPIYGNEWSYDLRVANLRQQRQNQSQQPVNDEQIKKDAFDMMLNDTLISMEMAKVGVTTTPDELDAIQTGLDGVEIAEYLKQIQVFRDRQTGQFSKDSLDKNLQMVMAQFGDDWSIIEQQVARSNQMAKYFSMISKGLLVTDYEAKRKYTEENQKANIQYVYKEYRKVPDSVVTVTDADYQSYYDEHKNDKKYEMEETRAFKYVTMDIIPSAADTQTIMDKAQELKTAFEKVKPQNDSLFVISRSDTRRFDGSYKQPGSFPLKYDSIIQNAEVGTVVGPFIQGPAVKIAKVMESFTEEQATVRHILVKTKGDTTKPETWRTAKLRADSIIRVYKADTNKWSELMALSEDPGSKSNGGVYRWFPKGQMVAPFEEFSFRDSTREIEAVKTVFGYHVVERLGRRNAKKVKAPTIDKLIVPFERTVEEYKDSAIQFVLAAKKVEDFEQFAKDQGFFLVREVEDLKVSNPVMPKARELNNNNNILRWAFNADLNEVSDFFYLKQNHKIAIAKLTKKIPEGTPSLETAKQLMHDEIVKMKKANYLREQAKGAASLKEVSAAWNTQGTLNSPSVAFSAPNLAAPGSSDSREEYKVVGTVFTLEPNKVSEPIEGEEGMYVVKVLEFIPVANPKEDFENDRLQAQSGLREGAQTGVVLGLRSIADIKDYRKKRELIDED